MAGMENKQQVSTTSSVSAARETPSTTPPLGKGRSVAFPPPEPEIVPIATTPVPEQELTVEVEDRPTTAHTDEIWMKLYCTRLTTTGTTRYSLSHLAYPLQVVNVGK